jgi:hypothetical protein
MSYSDDYASDDYASDDYASDDDASDDDLNDYINDYINKTSSNPSDIVLSNEIGKGPLSTVECGIEPFIIKPKLSGNMSFIEDTIGASSIAQGLEGEQRAYGIEQVNKTSRLGNAGDLSMTTFSDDPKLKSLMMRSLKYNPKEFYELKLLNIMASDTFYDYLNNLDKEKIYKYYKFFIPTEKHYKHFNVTHYVMGYILNKITDKDKKIETLDKLHDDSLVRYGIKKIDILRYADLVGSVYKKYKLV